MLHCSSKYAYKGHGHGPMIPALGMCPLLYAIKSPLLATNSAFTDLPRSLQQLPRMPACGDMRV